MTNLLFISMLCCFVCCSDAVDNIVNFDNSIVEIGLKNAAESAIRLSSANRVHTEKSNSTGCSCHGYRCGCCETLDIPKIDLNETGCVNISYLPAPEYGISLTLTVNKFVLFNRTVSVRNPPPVCVGVPHLKKYASLCVKFYNLALTKTKLSGCIQILAKLKFLLVEKIDLGCFSIPFPAQNNHKFSSMYNILSMKEAFKLQNLQLNP